jgi:hypothetical protein
MAKIIPENITVRLKLLTIEPPPFREREYGIHYRDICLHLPSTTVRLWTLGHLDDYAQHHRGLDCIVLLKLLVQWSYVTAD